jgi:hypothetical protein
MHVKSEAARGWRIDPIARLAYGEGAFAGDAPMSAPPRSFQEILMRLQAYWAARG